MKPRLQARRTLRAALRTLFFLAVLQLGAVPWACGKTGTGSRPDGIKVAAAAPSASVDLSLAIIRVARQTIPAVVHIEVTERREVETPFLPFGGDPFLRRFFGNPEAPRKFRRELRGLGTGMIIDPYGRILTNHHVVGGATRIRALLADGSTFDAKLLGSDPKTDLAIIEIEAKRELPQVTFGNSDQVEVGSWVVAIGHPRGLDQTVTQGIVSAKNRRGITDPTGYEDFLQTDAAINPGNSGGPLLDLHGYVIGVNAVIASQSGGFEGVGFAIPSNMAVYVARQLIASGKVERGWIGVTVQDLTQELSRSLQLESTRGVLVSDLIPGGPAAKAGLRQGDVILRFADREVNDSGSLRNAVAEVSPGKTAGVQLLRKGKQERVTVTVGDSRSALETFAADVTKRLGVKVRAVTPQEAQKYGLEESLGVGIASLEPEGPLAAAGLEVHDLILQIEGQKISGVESFIQTAVLLQPGTAPTLLAVDHRTGQVGTIQIRLP
jgi:serine protease Do